MSFSGLGTRRDSSWMNRNRSHHSANRREALTGETGKVTLQGVIHLNVFAASIFLAFSP